MIKKTIKLNFLMRAAMTLTLFLLTSVTAWAETATVSYIDSVGIEQTVTATVLTGYETSLGTADSTTLYVVNNNIYHASTIECKGHVILILADDCTMTASAGINIAGGYTLNIYSQQGDGGTIIITGCNGGNGEVLANMSLYHEDGYAGGNGINGSLTVNGGTINITGGQGGQGYHSYYGTVWAHEGGEGGMGGYGINGSLTVNGGTINITGGAGGKGGDKNGGNTSDPDGGNGGNGAEGIKGTLSVNGGFITINGGNGGEGGDGYGPRGRGAGSPGSAGYAVDGTVTFDAETILMEESDDQSTWSNLTSGSTSTKRYIRTGGDSFTVSGDEYTIWNATGWGKFCDLIEGGESFSGKTVKLGANITVSRIAGSGAGSNLTTSDRPFCGTFDGYGNTLTFNYGSSGNPADENNVAPFRYVNNATIQHLHVAGDIYTQHVHAGGIIGMAYGTTNIIDCHSSVNIHSSINGDGTHGGIMSCSWTGSTTNITGCLFDGSIQSAANYATDQCGGFVGWRNATINVKNCLLTADLSTIVDPEGLQYPSGTFVRNGNANTITNSYYTAALGTIQGKQARSITAGENVTIEDVWLTGKETSYDVSGITAYDDGGIKRTVGSADTYYYGQGDKVTVTLSNTATGAPTGYLYDRYTASGGNFNHFDDNIWMLTMPDADVTISVNTAAPSSDGQQHEVSYVDAAGNGHTAQAVALDGTKDYLEAGTYFVGTDIIYNHTLELSGDVILILKDGCTMNVGTSGSRISDGDGIKCYDEANDTYNDLTIYGQSLGTGKLSIYVSGNYYHAIAPHSITVNGGNVITHTDGKNSCGIDTKRSGDITINGGNVSAITTDTYIFAWAITAAGNITINGGNVNAESNSQAIHADGNIDINSGNVTATTTSADLAGIYSSQTITLGWTNATDRIYASSYRASNNGTVSVKSGQAFVTDDATPVVIRGTVSDLSTINGKTLRPHLLLGDVNGDGDVNISDVIMLVNIILGNVTEYDMTRANVNGDGDVNISDAILVVNIILGNN